MLKTVILENFKCYGKEGARFDLAPLTFLYGDNSSGKSTFLQAISLLSDTLRSKSEEPFDIDPARRITDFDDDPFNALVFKHAHDSTIRMRVETLYNGKTCVIERHISKNLKAVCLKETIEGAVKDELRAFLPMVQHCVAPRPETARTLGSSLSKLASRGGVDAVVKYVGDGVNAKLSRLGYRYEFVSQNLFQDLVFGIPVAAKNVGASVHAIANILNSITSLMKGGILLLEEPETHLHPKYIGPFAEIIVEAIGGEEVTDSQIVVECHSDMMILAIQGLIRQKLLPHSMVKIIHITKNEDGASVLDIPFDENGVFVQDWPGGFYPERRGLLLRGWL